ncbi:MAG: cell division protein FtsL [Thermacetogeniaceae bacterium]
MTLVVLAGFALCMLYTYQTTRIIALGYQTDNLQNSVNELQGENKQLGLKIAELQAPERVQQIATTKLGMKEPQEFMIAFSSPEQLSSQKTQVQAVSPKNSWSGRLLAVIPRFIGQAEASPR